MPALPSRHAHDLLELALHLRWHVRTQLAEILEVGRREDQRFSRAIVAEIVVALLVFRGLGPVEKVRFPDFGLLREEIVGSRMSSGVFVCVLTSYLPIDLELNSDVDRGGRDSQENLMNCLVAVPQSSRKLLAHRRHVRQAGRSWGPTW